MPTYSGGDVIAKQGQTWSETLTFRDQSGNPLNFLGASAWMDVRTPAGQLALHLDSAGNGIILGGAAGTLVRSVTAAQTQILAPSLQYCWDLYLVLADGTVPPPLEGTFTVQRRITA
jgi:hypothetical protein